MINIELAYPVYTMRQVKKIAAQAGLDEEMLLALANGTKCVVVKESSEPTPEGKEYGKFGDVISHPCFGKSDDLEMRSALERWERENCLTGADAVNWICRGKEGLPLSPVKAINIPYDLFWSVSERQWLSISRFAAKVDSRNSRIEKLLVMQAPDVILYNEFHQLWVTVERLEANDWGPDPVRWQNGLIMRALNDVGYSLAYGWERTSDWDECKMDDDTTESNPHKEAESNE